MLSYYKSDKMILEDIINKLSIELQSKIYVDDNALETIKEYINMALVIGLEEQILIYNNKSILMLNKQGMMIKTFYRMKDAALYIKKTQNRNSKYETIRRKIYEAINGKRNNCYKYYWRYLT